MHIRPGILAATFLSLTVSACSDDAPATVASIAFPSASVQISLREPGILFPAFLDANGASLVGINAAWTSSNTSVVSIDDDGGFFGVALGGPVTITVSAGGRSATTQVTVVPDKVEIAPGTATLSLGTTRQMTATVFDFEGTAITVPVTWSSTNAVAAGVVPATGLVTGAAIGSTSIVASAAGRADTLILEVGVATPLDGHWAGNATIVAGGATHPISFDIVFGTVREFRLTISRSSPVPGCVETYIAFGQGATPIVNDAFQMTLSPTPSSGTSTSAVVSATFTTPSAMSGTATAFRFGPNLACVPATSGFPPSDMPFPTTTMAAARQ